MLVTKETREYVIWPGGMGYVLVKFVGEDGYHDIPTEKVEKPELKKPPRSIVSEKIRQYKQKLEEQRQIEKQEAEKRIQKTMDVM